MGNFKQPLCGPDFYLREHPDFFPMLVCYNAYCAFYGKTYTIEECLLKCRDELSKYDNTVDIDELLVNINFIQFVVEFLQELPSNESLNNETQ